MGGKFDLIITDLNMPVMDGLTMIRELRKKPGQAGVPIMGWKPRPSAAPPANRRKGGSRCRPSRPAPRWSSP
jgi:two-component system chemotaxis response regulator CheY